MSPHLLSWNGHEADRHESTRSRLRRSLCAVVRLIWLDDTHEANAEALQPTGERVERRFIGRRQHHCIRAFGQVSRATLTGRVNKVRGLDASREIRSNDHVVGQDEALHLGGGLGISRCNVAVRTCFAA